MKLDRNELSKAVRLVLSLGAVTAVGTAGTAFAQDNGDQDQQNAQSLQTITVVGSRIRRADVETSQPVFVLDQQDIRNQGLTSVADVLQRISTNGAALNTSFNNGGNGAANLSLRDLGANRTLVLVNGHRWVTSLGGTVDLNTIPASIIQRVEVLKDGASTIYGSDAIAGVVNIVTVDRFDGAEAHAYWGEYDDNDGRRQAYDFTIGSTTDRASLIINASYVQEEAVLAGNRDISKEPVFGTGKTTRSLFADHGCFYNSSNNDFKCINPDGNPLNLSDFHDFTNDDRYNYAPDNFLLTPQQRTALYAQGRYNITDNISFHAVGLFNQRKSSQKLAPAPIGFGPNGLAVTGFNSSFQISPDSYYNPTNTDRLPGGPGDALDGFHRFKNDLPDRQFLQDVETFHFGGYFEGYFDLGEHSYNWDVGYGYSQNNRVDTNVGYVNDLNLSMGVGPSFLNDSGVVQCGTPDDPISFSVCTPVNFLLPNGQLPADQANYLSYTAHDTYHNDTIDYTADITGDLFQLPAGPFSFAAGWEYRNLQGNFSPDAFTASGFSSGNAALPTAGSYSLNEGYLEFAIPVLKDLPLAQSLDFSVAGRLSSYSNFGETTNGKFGFKWKPIDDLLIRGNYAEGFRAPTISELFGGNADSFPSVADPCSADNPNTNAAIQAACAAQGVPAGYVQAGGYESNAQIRSTIGSNPDLKPETATNKTLGLVYSPSYLSGLDLSLDWYDIKIDGAAFTPSAQFIFDQCYIQGDTSFCPNITRNGDGIVTDISQTVSNVATIETEGYDLTVHYRLPDTAFGRFNVTWDTNYVSAAKQQNTSASPVIETQGNYFATDPEWRIKSNLNANWQLGDWGATYGLRYRSGLTEACVVGAAFVDELCSNPDYIDPTGTAAPQNRLGAVTYHDVQVRYDVPWNATVSLGVNNLFDKTPPLAFSSFANSYDPQYDVPGRFYYAEYRQKF